MKHTPGPWHQIDTKESHNHQIWECVKTGKHGPYQHKIAEVINYQSDMDKANATLISAAPDLLSALIAIEKAVPCHGVHCRHYDLGDGSICTVEAKRIAKSAIQKAIGQ